CPRPSPLCTVSLHDALPICTALRKLRSGLAIGIFIQGTRSAGSNPALDGAAFLALRSGAALVPTAVWREGRKYVVSFGAPLPARSEEHTSELQSRFDLVFRL